ncbi:MAG: ribosomal S17-domain-containing protein [Monoraphidium minutum]|nr:MAG: ribosomal S17-domain-containing protein [Monoraphidium minutum]
MLPARVLLVVWCCSAANPLPLPPPALYAGPQRAQRAQRCTHKGSSSKAAANMGRVRTKTVKKASRVIIEKYYSRLTQDFDTNKRMCEEIAIIQSKRLRNKIAGFTTHLMKRIQRGPVRGISLKLQEEERERRMDFVPEESAINVDNIEVDRDTLEMLKAINMGGLPGVTVAAAATAPAGGAGGFRKEGGFQKDFRKT